jgi:4-aminobutyrate aminotransferase-like enzyme
VLLQTAGATGEVLKFLPPLTIDEELFARGLDIVGGCLERVMSRHPRRTSPRPELAAS